MPSLHSFVLRFLLPVTCLALAQCSGSRATSVAPAPKVEWYIATKEPLTYCPTGHKLPVPDTAAARGAEYIYLADRTTRFHIPPGCMAHRREALALREDSKSVAGKFLTSTENTISWVGRKLGGAVAAPFQLLR
ncbi:MAG: hypothetical protein HS117_19685 [Verrucomicrobiaceae bacterium]|jgi:hypothetical protein|nr:hypothetical protein [Verrucomicrobiaceae bacterium]